MPATFTIQDDNTPYKRLVEQDEADVPNAETGGYNLFIDEADGLVKLKDSSGTVTIVGSGAGAGAPDDAKYVIAASHVDLTAEIVIPGVAGSADRSGIGGAGVSYEFDSGASPLTWSTAVDTENVNSTIPSHLYVQDNANAETLGTFTWSPAGAFDIRMKVSMGSEVGTSTAGPAIGLIVGDTAMNNRVMAMLLYDGATDSYGVDMYTYASSVYSLRGVRNVVRTNSVYLRITRDGSNNCSFYYSMDGLTWLLVATQSFTFTAGKAGLRLHPANLTTTIAIDWLRTSV